MSDKAILPEPPALPEAEQQLFSILLVKTAWFDLVADRLRSEMFSEEAFGCLWDVLAALAAKGHVPTYSMLSEAAAEALGWERAEVLKFLAKLAGDAVTLRTEALKQYADLIRDVWVRRELWHCADEIQASARSGSVHNSGQQILEEVEARLFALSANADSDERSQTLAQAIAAGIDQAQAAAAQHEKGDLVGVSSGLSVVDRKLGGFRETDVVVIGARSGMGKTAWALKAAVAAAKQFSAQSPEKPKWVVFFSMEMSADQLALRMTSAQARVSFEKIRLGLSETQDLMGLERAGRDLEALPMLIDDTPRLSVPAMRTRARRLKRKHGLGLVVIDYLQLIGLSRDEAAEHRGNRVQEVSAVTRNLKAMAKDLHVPVIALCQLNREVEKREDKRPQLSDLRESGSIEMDADVVAFLYRDVYYLRQQSPVRKPKEGEVDYGMRRVDWQNAVDKGKNKAEFIIGKNRHGSLGTLALRFAEEFMLFEDDSPLGAGETDEQKFQMAMDLAER